GWVEGRRSEEGPPGPPTIEPGSPRPPLERGRGGAGQGLELLGQVRPPLEEALGSRDPSVHPAVEAYRGSGEREHPHPRVRTSRQHLTRGTAGGRVRSTGHASTGADVVRPPAARARAGGTSQPTAERTAPSRQAPGPCPCGGGRGGPAHGPRR